MNGSLATAVLAGLGGMAGWGVADFLAKKTLDRVGEVTTLFWAQVVGVLPLLAIFAATHNVPTVHRFDTLWLVLLGIVSALSYLSLYAGFGKGPVSLLSPVFSAHAALVVVLSAAFFSERITGEQWVAIVVVIAGVIAISTTPGELGQALRSARGGRIPGLSNVLSAAVAFAFWLVFLDRFIGVRDWVLFLIVIRVTAAVTVGVYAKATHEPLLFERADLSLMGYVASIGLCDAAAFSAVSYGFSATTHTSVVAVLSSTVSLPTMILARIFLKERMGTAHKIAAGVIVAGIALVSI
jgi:drug/metabolite transporter (DMT)-like permease